MLNGLFGQQAGFVLKLTASFMILAGISLTYYSLLKIRAEFNTHITPNGEILDLLYEKRRSNKGPEIVAFGGGTGLSNLLRGLKTNSDNLTAVVTVADDGGSSGRLRDEMGILPPGDIRNCLVALADREPLMEKLFQHRFESEGGLEGQELPVRYWRSEVRCCRLQTRILSWGLFTMIRKKEWENQQFQFMIKKSIKFFYIQKTQAQLRK
jgi:hypothetical protein